MKRNPRNLRAFTLTEVMVVLAVTAIISAGIVDYAYISMRMVVRNLTVNHGHDAARGALERMLSVLHQSASQFTLINVNAAGTSYSDVSPTYTTGSGTAGSDTDLYFTSGTAPAFITNDNRANGVRFYLPAGTGPYQLTGDGVANTGTISANSTTLEFDFKNSGYIPASGDVLQIPLIYSGEYGVTGTAVNTSGTKYKVTLTQSTGYTLYTGTATTNTGITYNSGNPANTAGYFYRRAAFTVLNNQLRYHPNFTNPTSAYPCSSWAAAATDVPVVIRNNVASIAPFSLLVQNASSSTTGLYSLRVSLVAYDLNYSARAFTNGSTTILDIINPRTVTDQQTILSTLTR
jgi:prepilin-type N-terminal cleavage/methylation domain-containing protein